MKTDKKKNKFVSQFKKTSEARGRGTWFLPFAIVIVCLYFISNVPVDDSALELHSGKLIKYDFKNNCHIKITYKKDDCEKTSVFEFAERYEKLLQSVLPSAECVKIWTNKNSSWIRQLSIDGKIIIEYGSWWRRTDILWVGVLIGLLLIKPALRGLKQDIKDAKNGIEERETDWYAVIVTLFVTFLVIMFVVILGFILN